MQSVPIYFTSLGILRTSVSCLVRLSSNPPIEIPTTPPAICIGTVRGRRTGVHARVDSSFTIDKAVLTFQDPSCATELNSHTSVGIRNGASHIPARN
jgi:hypothetical protein